MTAEDSRIDKSEWRRQTKAARDSLSAAERQTRSARLCAMFETQLLAPLRVKLGRPLRIAVYAAFRSEADPAALTAACLQAGDRVVAPRILPDGSGMELREITALTDWTKGKWDVPEPDPERTRLWKISLPLDIILVPGLAFNAAGERLGYGGGYYDRLYASMRLSGNAAALWIGFAFAMQLVKAPLPREPHDLRLDGVVTDDLLQWFKA